MSAQNRAVRSRKTWRHKQPRGPKNLRGPPKARGPWHLPKVPPLNPPLLMEGSAFFLYIIILFCGKLNKTEKYQNKI